MPHEALQGRRTKSGVCVPAAFICYAHLEEVHKRLAQALAPHAQTLQVQRSTAQHSTAKDAVNAAGTMKPPGAVCTMLLHTTYDAI